MTDTPPTDTPFGYAIRPADISHWNPQRRTVTFNAGPALARFIAAVQIEGDEQGTVLVNAADLPRLAPGLVSAVVPPEDLRVAKALRLLDAAERFVAAHRITSREDVDRRANGRDVEHDHAFIETVCDLVGYARPFNRVLEREVPVGAGRHPDDPEHLPGLTRASARGPNRRGDGGAQ